MPVSAPLGITGLLPDTDSPLGSQILSDVYLLSQVTSESARTVHHKWQHYTVLLTSLLL